jgi:hypothetical protein
MPSDEERRKTLSDAAREQIALAHAVGEHDLASYLQAELDQAEAAWAEAGRPWRPVDEARRGEDDAHG